MAETIQSLSRARNFYIKEIAEKPQQLILLTREVRRVAREGTDTPFTIEHESVVPEVILYDGIIDKLGGRSLRGEIDPTTLRELDALQCGAEMFSEEWKFATTQSSVIETARRHMAYRGRLDPQRFGFTDLKDAARRAMNASVRKTSPAHAIVSEALSNSGIHGIPIVILGQDGTEIEGNVESIGRMSRYGRPGLGLSVVTRKGARKIVEIGGSNYRTRP